MKWPAKSTFFTILVGFAAGLAAGHRFAGAGSDAVPSVPPPTRTSAPAGSTADAAKAIAASGTHNLKALLRREIAPYSGLSDFSKEIERMSVAALKAMLLDGLYPYRDGEDEGLGTLRSALTRELFKREGEKALLWADGLDPADREGILGGLINSLAEQDFVAALPWIDGFGEKYGQERVQWFSYHAISGATQRGAAALLELLKLYGNRLPGTMMPQGGLPEDFDFGLYLTGTARPGQPFAQRNVMGLWAAKDREAAFQYVKNATINGTPGGTGLFGLAFQGVAKMDGLAAAGGWVAGKLDELPAASRSAAINSLFSISASPGPDAAAELVHAFPREEDRVALVASFIRPYPWKSSAADYANVLGSETAWAQAVEASAKRFAESSQQGTAAWQEKQMAFYDALMAKTAVPEAARERVRAVWRAKQP